jgi:hypothetical protein
MIFIAPSSNRHLRARTFYLNRVVNRNLMIVWNSYYAWCIEINTKSFDFLHFEGCTSVKSWFWYRALSLEDKTQMGMSFRYRGKCGQAPPLHLHRFVFDRNFHQLVLTMSGRCRTSVKSWFWYRALSLEDKTQMGMSFRYRYHTCTTWPGRMIWY